MPVLKAKKKSERSPTSEKHWKEIVAPYLLALQKKADIFKRMHNLLEQEKSKLILEKENMIINKINECKKAIKNNEIEIKKLKNELLLDKVNNKHYVNEYSSYYTSRKRPILIQLEENKERLIVLNDQLEKLKEEYLTEEKILEEFPLVDITLFEESTKVSQKERIILRKQREDKKRHIERIREIRRYNKNSNEVFESMSEVLWLYPERLQEEEEKRLKIMQTHMKKIQENKKRYQRVSNAFTVQGIETKDYNETFQETLDKHKKGKFLSKEIPTFSSIGYLKDLINHDKRFKMFSCEFSTLRRIYEKTHLRTFKWSEIKEKKDKLIIPEDHAIGRMAYAKDYDRFRTRFIRQIKEKSDIDSYLQEGWYSYHIDKKNRENSCIYINANYFIYMWMNKKVNANPSNYSKYQRVIKSFSCDRIIFFDKSGERNKWMYKMNKDELWKFHSIIRELEEKIHHRNQTYYDKMRDESDNEFLDTLYNPDIDDYVVD